MNEWTVGLWISAEETTFVSNACPFRCGQDFVNHRSRDKVKLNEPGLLTAGMVVFQ